MADFIQDALVLKCTSKECGNNGGHVYNVKVNTPADGDEWFGCGFEDPKLNEGDECEFEIENVKGGYTNIILDTLVVTKAAPQRERSNRGGRSSGRGNSNSRGRNDGGRDSGRSSGRSSSRNSSAGSGRGQSQSRGRAPAKEAAPKVDWERKDNLIRLQSCQNTAIKTIAVMLLNGFIAIPKAKADRYDAIQALIEDEANRLYFKYEDIVDGNQGNDGGGRDDNDQDEYPDDDVPS